MAYVCTNCGDKVSREEFLAAKGFNCHCDVCKKLSKKAKEKRAREKFEAKQPKP